MKEHMVELSAKKLREQPHDKPTACAGCHAHCNGHDNVGDVLGAVAEGGRVQGYAKRASVTAENGQVIKVLELVNDGEDPSLWESSEADSVKRFIEFSASVKWLYEFKHSLLLAVETYKLLLACHLLLLLATIAVLVAMARA